MKIKHYPCMSLLLICCISCISAYGQRDNTVYQNLTTNSTAAQPATFGPVTNIGQGFHQLQIIISAIPTHTCTVTNTPGLAPTIGFIGSYAPGVSKSALSQTNFVDPGPNTGPFYITVQATGAYPFVYVVIDAIDVANCQYTINYSGSLFPPAPLAPTNGFGYGAFQSSAAATTTLLAAQPFNMGFGIYEITIDNATANQTVTLKCGATVLKVYSNLVTGQHILLPYNGLPYTVCPTAGAFTMTLANATQVNLDFYYGITILPLSSP